MIVWTHWRSKFFIMWGLTNSSEILHEYYELNSESVSAVTSTFDKFLRCQKQSPSLEKSVCTQYASAVPTAKGVNNSFACFNQGYLSWRWTKSVRSPFHLFIMFLCVSPCASQSLPCLLRKKTPVSGFKLQMPMAIFRCFGVFFYSYSIKPPPRYLKPPLLSLLGLIETHKWRPNGRETCRCSVRLTADGYVRWLSQSWRLSVFTETGRLMKRAYLFTLQLRKVTLSPAAHSPFLPRHSLNRTSSSCPPSAAVRSKCLAQGQKLPL